MTGFSYLGQVSSNLRATLLFVRFRGWIVSSSFLTPLKSPPPVSKSWVSLSGEERDPFSVSVHGVCHFFCLPSVHRNETSRSNVFIYFVKPILILI